jgi:uncharacterized protein YukE
MAKAVVDPEILRSFAGSLSRFTNDLRERSIHLQQQYSRLGESWRDQEQEKFAEEFSVMLAALNRFATTSEQQVPVLIRKAAAIQEYLEGH